MFFIPFEVVLRFAFGFVIGAALGSFGSMLAYRLPRGLSIVLPRSHCPSCKTVLGPLDLVPIASWLAFGGRCRHCHAKIGPQYLAIELATSVVCAALAVVLGFSAWLVLAYAIVVALAVAVSIKVN
jgi:prepilin signal peptidase PulO-like enzyme (type II secretory pathway)